MDSMTLIAMASIVTAGLTIALGSIGPALGEGRAVATALELPGAAARCRSHDHPHPVRRPGDDRVHRDLLLRGLDDPDLRQSVLESRHRPSRGKVAMLIDWFTVGAQALNFLVLVWLLKRFLYKPILDAVDAREKADRQRTRRRRARRRPKRRRSATSSSTRTPSSTASAPRSSARRRTRRMPNASACSTKRARRPMPRAPSARRRCADEARNLESGDPPPHPAGSLRDRAQGADGSRYGQPGRAHGRNVHCAACGRWTARQKPAWPQRSRRRPDPAVVRSAFDLPTEQRTAIQKAIDETFSRRIPPPVRDRAGSDQRHRTHGKRPKDRLEHRGISRVAGKQRR